LATTTNQQKTTTDQPKDEGRTTDILGEHQNNVLIYAEVVNF